MCITKNYSQDPDILDKEWFLHYGILNGEEFEPPYPSFFTAELYFDSENEFLKVSHPYCEESLSTSYLFGSNNEFTIEDADVVLAGICAEQEILEFMPKHYNIYGDEDGNPKNPFTYSLESDGDNYMLTIENGEGDIAVYGDVQLSVTDFEASSFLLYPNPATDILTLSSREIVKEVAVYDIHGKLVKTSRFNNEPLEIDVSTLQNGLYFLRIETEVGRVATAKFIKK